MPDPECGDETPQTEHPNQRWSMDFLRDGLLPGVRVVQVLEQVSRFKGRPELIVVDNGPKFAGKALNAWPMSEMQGYTSSSQASWSRTPTFSITGGGHEIPQILHYITDHGCHPGHNPKFFHSGG